NNVVLLATVAKARDVAPAKHGFQWSANIADIYADIRQFVSIDPYFKFGCIESKVGVQILQAWVVRQLVHQLVNHGCHLRVGGLAHDDKVDWLRSRPLPERWWVTWKGSYARDSGEFRL